MTTQDNGTQDRGTTEHGTQGGSAPETAATAPRSPGAARALLVAACVVAAVNLVAQVAGWRAIGQVSIWLFMPLLGLWALTAAPRPLGRPVTLLLVGTVFAWGGDVLLSFGGDVLFPLGIASFLGMQVLYILAFRSVPGPGLVRAWPIAWIPYVAVWLVMNWLMRDGVGVLMVPVLVYSAALVLMAVQALDLVLRVARPLGWRIAWGGALFVVSDGLIALREFAGWLPSGAGTSFAIMVTYVAAQLMIVTGFVRAVGSGTQPP